MPALRQLLAQGVAIAGFAASTEGQSSARSLTGRVVDSLGVPVAYANLEVGGRSTVADDSGRFRLAIPRARTDVSARRIGFAPQSVALPAGSDTSIVITMQPLAQTLSRSTVTAQHTVSKLETRGFYRRMHDRRFGTNAGQFITAEQIDRRNPTRISMMLEGRTGVRVQRVKTWRHQGDGCEEAQGPLCWAPMGPGGCFMAVYFDGMRLPTVQGLSAPHQPTLIDAMVLPRDIAGIEIYTTPGKAPPEYQSLNGTCGVVLLWSK